MSLSFFGKSKENADMAQTAEIKEATALPEFKGPSNDNSSPQMSPSPAQNSPMGNPSPFPSSPSNMPANPFENPEFSHPNQMQNPQANSNPFSSPSSQEHNEFNNPFANPSPNQMQSPQTTPIQTNQQETNPTFGGQNEQSQPNPFNQASGNMNQNGMGDVFTSIQNEANAGQSLNEEKIQEMIDETIEKVIEERWEKLVSGVEKVLKWKEKQEAQINLIKEDIVHLRDAMEIMEKKIIGRINSYDSNIMDVNSEIKALEKVFQKITPTLINNVNELSKIADNLKTGKSDEVTEYPRKLSE